MPSQQGYDRAITVFSPDGRLYQVEYAIETVKRGTIALGIKTKDGIVFAADERPRKLQIVEEPQKLFKIDQHIGVQQRVIFQMHVVKLMMQDFSHKVTR